MSPERRSSRIAAPVLAAVATGALFTAALWVQHGRAGWPFDNPTRAAELVVDAAVSPVSEQDFAGSPAASRVPVDAASTHSLDIRLETVARHALARDTRAVASIVPDESRISHVHPRVTGWVEQLDVNTTGEEVRVGQPLARIFSQELLSSQTEYLSARTTAAASGITSAVLESGRMRLGVLGMTEGEIAAIERSGEPMRLVTIVAPRSGVVINRGVSVGTSVDPSTTLLTVADLSSVWALAEVPEADIPSVSVGETARLDFPASGRPPFNARVAFLYPTLTERTRTLTVRFSVANNDGALRPGIYGTATFQSAGTSVITVPRDSIVDTGDEQHVFVAVGDRFEPRSVIVGAHHADRVEIREGLTEGERVVASGVFLLDSESRLRATGGGAHAHAARVEGEH